jgi:hypothetical protein
MAKKIYSVLFIALMSLLLLGAYRFARSHVAADVYRERYEQKHQENLLLRSQYSELLEGYGELKDSYNDAVKKTAVTELVVYEDSSVCVAFVNSDGTEKTIETPFKMGSEIYVDFVVKEGRPFFRRIFDENTAPKKALMIDAQKQAMVWGSDKGMRGKAAYTKLDEPGRWTVTLSGNGSLDISKKLKSTPPTVLMKPPPVKEYPSMKKDYPESPVEVQKRVDEIGPDEVFRSLFGSAQS